MSNLVEIRCKHVPHNIQFKQWQGFVNKWVKHKKWVKNFKQGDEWVILVNANEKHDWQSRLNGKSIQQNRITVYIKDHDPNSGGGRGGRGRGRGRGRGGHRQSAFGHHSNNRNYHTKGGSHRQLFNKHLTDKQQEDMLALCSQRYNSENKMLNLGGIVTDEQEHWASFSNQAFVQKLLDIIKQHCEDLKSLDLSNNNICTLEGFKRINQFAPYLENLSLLGNPIKSFSDINYLNSLKLNLRELYLQNVNLLNEVSQIKQLYVFEIIKRFPNLRLLDGEVVYQQPLVSFGKTTDDLSFAFKQKAVNIPVSPHNACTDQAQIHQFINNYYTLFDSNDRRKMINLYHVDAIFTLTFTPNEDTPTPLDNRSNEHKAMSAACNKMNRNLIDKMFQSAPRFKQLIKVKHGNLDIIQYLHQDFPRKTKHQISYMSIDCHPIQLNNVNFMQVIINGYYAENQDVARKFNRTWLLMQDSNGISISNDQFHIGGVVPQSKLMKHAPASSIADLNKQNKKGGTSQQVPDAARTSSGDLSLQMNGNNSKQQELIQKVAEHCKCPINISQQALEASNWDPGAAVTRIQTLISQRSQQQ